MNRALGQWTIGANDVCWVTGTSTIITDGLSLCSYLVLGYKPEGCSLVCLGGMM